MGTPPMAPLLFCTSLFWALIRAITFSHSYIFSIYLFLSHPLAPRGVPHFWSLDRCPKSVISFH